ncbi:hypothetical protein, partial [Chelatococcus sp.]|uniref:hypothetical protein n=1 Tax=Chelatococcus sp. TaxID=1953771 RepID=UPI0025C4F6DE
GPSRSRPPIGREIDPPPTAPQHFLVRCNMIHFDTSPMVSDETIVRRWSVLVPMVRRIDGPAAHVVADGVASHLLSLDDAVVTGLADALMVRRVDEQ